MHSLAAACLTCCYQWFVLRQAAVCNCPACSDAGGDVLNVLVAALIGGFSLGQAVPTLGTFAKGCAAGARLFAVGVGCGCGAMG